MGQVTFADLGAVTVGDPELLVGINDLELVETSDGPVLYATGRGGSWLTSIDLGVAGASSTVVDRWEIPESYKQVESAEIVTLPSGTGDTVYVAGLASTELEGQQIDGTDLIAEAEVDAGAFDMSTVSNIAFLDDGTGFASLTSGGVVQVTDVGGELVATSVLYDGPLALAQANDVIMFEADGTQYAVASYGSQNTVALFEVQPNGVMAHVQDVSSEDEAWINAPGAMASVDGLDGETYVIVTASGSSSLTVFQVDDGGLVAVDHRIDDLDTRFDEACLIETVEINGRPYVFVAGSDMGITVFGVLPGGALLEVGSTAATAETPIYGIMDMEVIPEGDGARIVVATQAHPYIVEFSMSFSNPGMTEVADLAGSSLTGGSGDDWLIGEAGNDTIVGGAGDDLIVDGGGTDSLTGGAGADLFQIDQDGATDTITDFDPNEDTIELLGIPLGNINLVQFISRPYGIALVIEDETLEVYSSHGGEIAINQMLDGALVFSEAVSVDPLDYEDTGPDYGPEMGSDLDPTRTLGLAPGVITSVVAPNIEAMTLSYRTSSEEEDEETALVDGEAIHGLGSNDTLHGQGGDDTLLGGGGFDTITGGGGHDRLDGGTYADRIDGGLGDDWIVGDHGFDNLAGGDGNDSLWGGSSPDRLAGGDGDDWLSAGDNRSGTFDGVDGGAGNDTLFGDGGTDHLVGGTGNDELHGGDAADNLYGEAGNDTLIGGSGEDRLYGGDGHDELSGGQEPDRLFGGFGDDSLWGGSEMDLLLGGSGNDIMAGGGNDDVLHGNAGFDTLIGGEGDDALWGDFNADRFVFEDGHGHDVIHDFDALNNYEVLDFSGLSVFASTTDVMTSARQEGADVVIDTGAASSITLLGVSLADLDGQDFLF